MKDDKKDINYKELFKNRSEFETKALEIMHKHVQIESLISSLKISDQEIIDNLFSFINLKESLDNSLVYPWFYNVTRKNGNLIFKKSPAKNDYKYVVTRQINLWLTEISEPDKNARINGIRLTTMDRKQLDAQISILTKAIAKKRQKGLKGLYVYGDNHTGKTYIAHALVNYFASESITSAYISLPALFNFLVKNFDNSNNINDDVIDKIKKVNGLVIDELGLEKNNKWFRLDVLSNILEDRVANNKITCFFSPMNPVQLEKYYMSQLKNEPFKARSFISRILSSTNHFCTNENNDSLV